MADLNIRQGTVYVRSDAAKKRLIINHNPMGLQALMLEASGADGAFDFGTLRIVSIDELIAMRKSAEWQDAGDLPAETFQQLLATLTALPGMPEELTKQLKALQKE